MENNIKIFKIAEVCPLDIIQTHFWVALKFNNKGEPISCFFKYRKSHTWSNNNRNLDSWKYAWSKSPNMFKNVTRKKTISQLLIDLI